MNKTVIYLAMSAQLMGAAVVLAAKPPKTRPADKTGQPADRVPGVVIDHIPAASGLYIGSPSIAILPNGDYVASHDHFGPKTTEHQSALTAVFRSADRGRTWKKISEIQGAVLVHALRPSRRALSPRHRPAPRQRHHPPLDRRRRHLDLAQGPRPACCATTASITARRCRWSSTPAGCGAAMERRDPPVGWGITYCAGMLSVPVDADLLDAANWTFSNFLPGDKAWLGGTFGGWLEGNAVVTRDGRLLDILRVETEGYPEKAAIGQRQRRRPHDVVRPGNRLRRLPRRGQEVHHPLTTPRASSTGRWPPSCPSGTRAQTSPAASATRWP